jgi:hypothetical protein
MNVEIHIEELVLDGLPIADRFALSEAVSVELARLIADQGAPALFSQSLHLTDLPGGTIVLTPGIQPESTGALVAQRLYQTLDHRYAGRD